jgi:hypothetical protein
MIDKKRKKRKDITCGKIKGSNSRNIEQGQQFI